MTFVGEYLGHTTNFEPIQDVEHLQRLEFDGVVGFISNGLPRGYPYVIFSLFCLQNMVTKFLLLRIIL